MPDLQTEIQKKVLEPSKEINNAILQKVHRGQTTSTTVKKAKIEHYKILMKEGLHAEEASKKVGVHWTTIVRWCHELGLNKGGISYTSGKRLKAGNYPAIISAVRDLIESGKAHGPKEAAKLLDISYSTFVSANRRVSVPLPRRLYARRPPHGNTGHYHGKKAKNGRKRRRAVKAFVTPKASQPIPVSYEKPQAGINIETAVAALVEAKIIHESLRDRVENILLRAIL